MSFKLSRRALLQGAAAQTVRRRPNLVFAFSDQQSSDMLGCYGNSQIATPRIDRFAKESVRFNHCVANSPLCTPYRGLLLSGQHPLRTAAFENDLRMLPGGGNYFGEVLRDAGYRTGYFGKWHLYGGDRNRPISPGPDRYGFDDAFLSNNCTVVFDAERAYYWDEQGKKQLYGEWEPYGQARQAARFIDENADRPFAMFVSWHPPHNWAGGQNGYAAPEDLLKLYDPAAIRLRGNCEDTPVNRGIYRGYMAMCTSIDRAFGTILDKLDEKGLAQDTIVIFTSDHGDTLRSHGLLHNKMRPEAESARVPLLVRHSGKLQARVSELLVGTLDLMPTLLSFLGLKPPATCQGKDLSQAILQKRDNEVDSIPLFLFPLDWRGVYTRRYTYSFDTNKGQPCRYRKQYFAQPAGLQWNCLYDREADRWELQNRFEDTGYRKVRRTLEERSRVWMRQFQDDGLPYAAIQRAMLSPEDLTLAMDESKVRMLSGRVKGRPLDLLRHV